MAVDTDTRKFSAVNLNNPWRGIGAIPSGALDEPEWFSLLHLYNEFAAEEGDDTTPDAFSFTDQTDVPLSSVRTSNTITVAGIDAPAAISVTGGTYSINGDPFTSSPGNVVAGDEVTARHTSSGSYSTATNTAVTIGGVSDTFTSTTLAGSTVPDVVGETEANAITAIEAENLIASVAREYHASVAEGVVISQDPAATTEVDEGSVVTILVSRGAAPAATAGSGLATQNDFSFRF